MNKHIVDHTINPYIGRRVLVTIRPGDFGTLFRLFLGYDKAWNRPVTIAHARSFGDKDLHRSPLFLLRSPCRTFYYIIDGQHRIWFISECSLVPVTLEVIMYDNPGDLPDRREYATETKSAAFIRYLNTPLGKKHTIGNHLENLQGASLWPAEFAKAGLFPRYEGKSPLTWAAILKAYLIYRDCVSRRMIVGASKIDPEDIWGLWTNADLGVISSVAEACAWWNKVALRAKEVHSEKKKPFNSLFAETQMVLALLTYFENKREIKLDGRVCQFDSPKTKAALKGNSVSGLPTTARAFLDIINWKKQTRLITLFGNAGR
jgi:hypothetical protein